MIRASAITDIGHARRTNEDAFIVDADLRLFAVGDGTGRDDAGEARLPIDALSAFIRRSAAVTEWQRLAAAVDPVRL